MGKFPYEVKAVRHDDHTRVIAKHHEHVVAERLMDPARPVYVAAWSDEFHTTINFYSNHENASQAAHPIMALFGRFWL